MEPPIHAKTAAHWDTEIMSNNSFWASSATSDSFQASELFGDHSVDVAIIGGGFTGLSAALHLAEAGVKSAILEAQTVGFGASGLNGGQVNPGLKHDAASLTSKFGEQGMALYRMGQGAPDFLFALIDRLGIQCGQRRPGLVRLAHNAQALKSLRAAGQTLAKEGVSIEELGPDDVKRVVGSSRYSGGLIDPRGGSVQPLDLARGLACAAIAKGVRIHQRTRATALERSGSDWVVSTPRGQLRCKSVVVATNGYTDTLVPRLARSLIPVNSFQIATKPLPASLASRILPNGHTVYDSRRLVLYFRRGEGDRIVMGGRASFGAKSDESSKMSDYAVLESVLHGIFPELKGIPIENHWKGLVCVTHDFLPHYHQPEPALHVMLGYNGRGVALANRSGAWLAHKIAGKADEGWYPETPIRTIPFHGMRQPALQVAMQYHRLMDWLGY